MLSAAPFAPVLQLETTSGVAFDAQSLEVSEWNDLSTSGNDMFGVGDQRPLFRTTVTPSGVAAIEFDGVDDRLLRSLGHGPLFGLPARNASRSVFLVAQFHDASQVGGASYGRFGTNKNFGVGVAGDNISVADDGLFAIDASGNSLVTSTPGYDPQTSTSGWVVLAAIHDDDGVDPAENTKLYADGVEIGSWNAQFNTITTTPTLFHGESKSRMVLGESIREEGNQRMDVAAWLVYDGALSEPDRLTVEHYLESKYLASSTSPVANDDTALVNAGDVVLIDVVANDNGSIDASTVTIVDSPLHGVISNVDPATGVVTYENDVQGSSDSFTYMVSDINGVVSNVAEVAVNTNMAPTAVDDSATVSDGGFSIITVLSNDTDADGLLDPTTVTIVDSPLHTASISIDSAGVISYQHDGSGMSDSFTYFVRDMSGEISNLATVTVTLVDQLPLPTEGLVTQLEATAGIVFDAQTLEVSQWSDQSPSGYNLFGAAGQSPTFSTTQTPNGVSAVAFDGVDDRLLRGLSAGPLTNLPAGNSERSIFLVARFHDATETGGASYGRFGSDRAFSVGVAGNGVDEGKLIIDTYGPGNTFVSGVNAYDPLAGTTGWTLLSAIHEDDGTDAAVNSYLFQNGIEIGAWDSQINTITNVTSLLGGESKSRIVLGEQIREQGNQQMDVAAWLIYDRAFGDTQRHAIESYLASTYLTAESGPPTANDDTQLVLTGQTVAIDVLGNDMAAVSAIDPSSVAIINPPTLGTITNVDPATGVVTYQHDGLVTSDSFTYRVADSFGVESNLATVSLTISAENLAPMANDDVSAVDENGAAVTVDLVNNDVPFQVGDTLQVIALDTAATVGTATISATLNGIDYDPAGRFEHLSAGQTTTDALIYTVQGPNSASDTASVTITITGENDVPVIASDRFSTIENQTLAGTIIASDVDQLDAVTFGLGSGGDDTSLFSVDPSTGRLSFLVAPQFNAPMDANADNQYEVSVTATDSQGGSATQIILVTVEATPLIRFGAVADVQYADRDPGPHPDNIRRWYRSSDQRLDEIVQTYNANPDLDFVIHLGDLINDTWESFDAMLDFADGTDYNPDLLTFRDLNHPSFQVVGNHEFNNIPDTLQPDGHDDLHVRERMGFQNNIAYYDFSFGQGYRFIVLDDQLPEANPQRPGSSFGLGSLRESYFDDQMLWSEQVIQNAWLADEKVILMEHYPMSDYYNQQPGISEWGQSLANLIETYPKIVAHLSGHFHDGPGKVFNGVLFDTMAGVVSSNPSLDQNVWYNMNLYEDHIVVDQFGENFHLGPGEDDKTFFWRTFPAAPAGGFILSANVETSSTALHAAAAIDNARANAEDVTDGDVKSQDLIFFSMIPARTTPGIPDAAPLVDDAMMIAIRANRSQRSAQPVEDWLVEAAIDEVFEASFGSLYQTHPSSS